MRWTQPLVRGRVSLLVLIILLALGSLAIGWALALVQAGGTRSAPPGAAAGDVPEIPVGGLPAPPRAAGTPQASATSPDTACSRVAELTSEVP